MKFWSYFLLGFAEIAQLMLVVLKLSGGPMVASWNWWAVLSLLWFPASVGLIFLVGLCFSVLLIAIAQGVLRISKNQRNTVR